MIPPLPTEIQVFNGKWKYCQYYPITFLFPFQRLFVLGQKNPSFYVNTTPPPEALNYMYTYTRCMFDST